MTSGRNVERTCALIALDGLLAGGDVDARACVRQPLVAALSRSARRARAVDALEPSRRRHRVALEHVLAQRDRAPRPGSRR